MPAALDEHFAGQGADHVLLFTEHSPKATGIQPIEDVLPVVRQNPRRFHPVANLNPHLHYPVAEELARQVGLGAIAVKIHPVHGGFEARDRMLYPAYAWAEQRGLPVIVHCGTSTFAGSVNSYADPILLDEVFRDFPDLVVVLAHGGRGWWYEQAAFLALMKPNVWLEVSGLPPQRLASYYGSSLRRLADKMIFGTDWPGVPSVQQNARAAGEDAARGRLHGRSGDRRARRQRRPGLRAPRGVVRATRHPRQRGTGTRGRRVARPVSIMDRRPERTLSARCRFAATGAPFRPDKRGA